MTENEYRDTTNLTTLRIADTLIRKVLPGGPVTDGELRELAVILDRLTTKLQTVVQTSGD